jgi:hypothetical protein
VVDDTTVSRLNPLGSRPVAGIVAGIDENGGVLVEVSQVLPAEVATRVASTLLREFAGRRLVEAEYESNGSSNIFKGTARLEVVPWLA